MRTFLHQRILLPLFETGVKGRQTFEHWRSLEDTQWWSAQRLAELQLDALRKILAHASAHSPYYRQTWQARGLDPARVKGLEDLAAWPVIDKSVLRGEGDRIRTHGSRQRLIAKATGGSTGVPLRFLIDAPCLDRKMAAWHRGYAWAGAAPGTRQLWLWGASFNERPWWRPWKECAYHALYHRKILDCFQLTDGRMAAFCRAIERYRPDVLVGYTSALCLLAEGFSGLGLRPAPSRAIVAAAEKLHDFQREQIERVFQAPVFETYGCREFMLIGAQCELREGLHLSSEQLLVEVLDDDGQQVPPGQEGNLVITDLYNFGFPFIRYMNGDRAIAGEGACSCGRGLPVLQKVVGRRLDVICTPDGRRIPGEFFPHMMRLDEFRSIRRFQVVQDAPDHVMLRFAASSPLSATERGRLDVLLHRVLGEQIQVAVQQVESIPLTPSGKLQVVVNQCAPPPSMAWEAH